MERNICKSSLHLLFLSTLLHVCTLQFVLKCGLEGELKGGLEGGVKGGLLRGEAQGGA